MTQPTGETGTIALYKHTARKDWGVAILIREDDGKRGYLFEDGEERTMANGYHQLMRRVEQPSAEQIAFYERRRALMARRERSSSGAPGGASFLDQLDRLHEAYPAGLTDPKWLTDIRGEGAAQRLPMHRDPLIREAQEQLSQDALDALIKAQNYGQVWELVTGILSRTDLVPSAQQKKAKSTNADGLRAVAMATRDLLHAKGPYEQRFDAYLAALTLIYGEAPHWEIATALSAAVHPSEHVCIHPTTFRQQLKAMGTRGPAPARATTAGYARFSSVARSVTKKLTEQSQPPRDLFDVYDFIRITLGPLPKVRATSAKPAKVAASPARKSKS